MTFRQSFSTGFNSYSKATSFIIQNKLGGYFIFPLVLNILLIAVGYHSVASWGNDVMAFLSDWAGMENWDFWGAQFLVGLIKALIWLLLRILFFLVYAYVGGYVILIFLSPVFAYLSERTEQIITGQDYPFNFNQFTKDILRGILLAIRNLSIELFFTFLLFLASFIPLLGYLTVPALVLLSSYFYGFSFIDYSLERKRLNIADSVHYIRSKKGLAIGNGLVFSLILMIPFVGVTIAGFVSIVSVVGATLAIHEVEKSNY
jgi:CysZ protein